MLKSWEATGKQKNWVPSLLLSTLTNNGLFEKFILIRSLHTAWYKIPSISLGKPHKQVLYSVHTSPHIYFAHTEPS